MDEQPTAGGVEGRIIRLETAQHYDRQLLAFHLGSLNQRLDRLESGAPSSSQLPTRDLTAARADSYPELTAVGWLKILLAIVLPLLALIVTGDPGKALLLLRGG